MPSSPPVSRKLTNPSPSRNLLVERCSSLRACEPCKRRKRLCNGQRPCNACLDTGMECVYSVISDHPRSVFTTSSARRLSSGSACETCRRRKTKCDGGSPCSFCAANGIECVNNSERRKRASLANAANPPAPGDNEAIDRIEDRLRRIERLMTAFSPSPLSQSTTVFENGECERTWSSSSYRKLSSPHPPPPPQTVRQHRHSVQGINAAKEQVHLRAALATKRGDALTRKATPVSPPASPHQPSPPSPSSPSRPGRILRQSSSHHTATQPLTSSMLNLSLSPSSSSTSSTSNSSSMPPPSMQPSMSTPNVSSPSSDIGTPFWSKSTTPVDQASNSCVTPPVDMEWKYAAPIPSLMDQLSRRTFATTAMDYTVHYPIYPLTPPHPSPSHAEL
ncbi:uncharacterized protein BYT42DRAFT_561844 [Radiomyces spectabilis]|uniref:uncharacterized protein n=1 Tax=Radiomyces spectabilis TaxID=64574 RepID=UPI00221FEA5A|nr:uncharacterized protein BYT42DRAFT_561844 [Radiomyces spectabilis]KAI8384238.1 hypothetical protein BYT42DRAFT_561844 [Radiomyces spectabilis]